MIEKIKKYVELKNQQKQISEELSLLRDDIISFMDKIDETEMDFESYLVKVVPQERRLYDDDKLYKSLPDDSLWRLMSKADTSKINGLLKLNIIKEDLLKDAYQVKKISNLQINKK
ncbi:hypothetical protein [Chengkuizengella axinellae]|uniref:Uncharacterized protein n=1 Tax=Chengkuizengella axinellae TaxID=3064388 RepID=A0ABT9J1S8_9BACL|nr:hypothetical protein [Chengkuizengella sp. 2205SS18-9]MDP5275558.1 hypothetical protein [Chengkuizengella sp. 2205SS18-9]